MEDQCLELLPLRFGDLLDFLRNFGAIVMNLVLQIGWNERSMSLKSFPNDQHRLPEKFKIVSIL